MDKKEYSIKDAAKHLGVSTVTIHNLTKKGLLTKHRRKVGIGIGGQRVYFTRAELDALKADAVETSPTNKK